MSRSQRDSSNVGSLKQTLNNIRTNTMQNAETKIKEKFEELTPILSKSQLKNLDQHKYSSSGNTLLDPYFQIYWNWLVQQVPLYVAPNLLTIVGLGINVLTSTILMLYSPNADSDLPAWSLLFCALGLFAYQSLDAIDGKQARRTNSSTPLGELFDHGCDAISTIFVMISFFATLQFGRDPWLLFFMFCVSLSAFYTAHWHTYVTGNLKFGKMDVTEAQLTIYMIYAVTAVFGDAIWSIKLPLLNFELRYIPAVMGVICGLVSVVTNINTISKGGKGKNGSSVADTSIVFPVFPLLVFFFMSFSIANKSTNIFLANKCMYLMTFGLVWAKITIKLIVAHMTKGELSLIDSCLLGPVILLLNQYFSYIIPEFYVLCLCFALAIFNLIEYCSKVCYQICMHMDIFLFKIKPIDGSSSTNSQTLPNTGMSHSASNSQFISQVTTRRQLQQQQQQIGRASCRERV